MSGKSDIRVKLAVLETIATCAQIAADSEHGDLGQTISNKITGLAVYAEDQLIGTYMLRDGLTRTEATQLAVGIREVLSP